MKVNLKWAASYLESYVSMKDYAPDHGLRWILESLREYDKKFRAIEALLATKMEYNEGNFRLQLRAILDPDPRAALKAQIETYQEQGILSKTSSVTLLGLLERISK